MTLLFIIIDITLEILKTEGMPQTLQTKKVVSEYQLSFL